MNKQIVVMILKEKDKIVFVDMQLCLSEDYDISRFRDFFAKKYYGLSENQLLRLIRFYELAQHKKDISFYWDDYKNCDNVKFDMSLQCIDCVDVINNEHLQAIAQLFV